MTYPKIPFNRSFQTGKELEYLGQASRGQISGDGSFTRRCSEFLEKELKVPHALLTTSCTHALEMAALLLEIRSGDEVIVPSYTFVSSANAFVLRGAKPIFADIRKDTLNIDETSLERLVSPRTRAVICVNYAGVGCEYDAIRRFADHHDLVVIEDNAHGLFGSYKGKKLGSLGDIATLSFHETKNFTCGEGGAIILNMVRYWQRSQILREKGTDRSRFLLGQVDKYTWVDLGSSYLPSDLLAAFLLAQFESKEKIQIQRKRVWEFYNRNLKEWAVGNGIQLPFIPDYCEQAYHMYYLLMPSEKSRNHLIEHLASEGMLGIFHYLPLHLSKMGRSFGGKEGDCPNAELVSTRIVRLPFYCDLTDEDLQRVIDVLLRCKL